MRKLTLLTALMLMLSMGKAQTIYESFEDFAPLLAQTGNDTTYVINFWATWCAPCVKELPYFEKLHQGMVVQKIKVILVSLDFRKDLETKLKPFLAQRQFSASIAALVDSRQNLWIDKIDPSWSGAVPATLVYRGSQRQFKEGEFESFEDLQQFVLHFFDPKN
ncbi:MAG: TlpA family protein disulfide reductase [Haliscomenobacter sp.]|uniref:TlpA family protein disulfide reductase n=1 Tax=Haliscomenobacter sp. TaxID=2717303 RepID=UPI0029A44E99|nr:TlpA family protein disulfide reductase [Haliscomenobacter sp.]MDX2071084.1 TlpA family protein disulfide reductase [Haliscomenobacter sp.]